MVQLGAASARLMVTVTNARNEPVADRDVVIFAQDERDWGPSLPGHGPSGRTDDKGQYQSPQLLAGQYYAAAVDGLENGQSSDPEFLTTLRPLVTRVDVRDGETAAVPLRAAD